LEAVKPQKCIAVFCLGKRHAFSKANQYNGIT